MATAASELAGTSETATYGPPYNRGSGSTQRILFSPETIAGVRHPVNAAYAFVLAPLEKLAPTDAVLRQALDRYNGATATTRTSWDNAYAKAVTKVKFYKGTAIVPRRA